MCLCIVANAAVFACGRAPAESAEAGAGAGAGAEGDADAEAGVSSKAGEAAGKELVSAGGGAAAAPDAASAEERQATANAAQRELLKTALAKLAVRGAAWPGHRRETGLLPVHGHAASMALLSCVSGVCHGLLPGELGRLSLECPCLTLLHHISRHVGFHCCRSSMSRAIDPEGQGGTRAAKGHGRSRGLLRPGLEALRGGRGAHPGGRPRQAHEADAGAPPKLRARARLLAPVKHPALPQRDWASSGTCVSGRTPTAPGHLPLVSDAVAAAACGTAGRAGGLAQGQAMGERVRGRATGKRLRVERRARTWLACASPTLT